LAIYIFSFILAAGAVITPGPVSITIVSQAPRQGWKTGPLVATGHAILEFVMVLMIVLGLGMGLKNPHIQRVIAIAGGGLLILMGAMMLHGVRHRKIHLPGPDQEQRSLSPQQLVGLGMLATISNPFWYAWWVTVAASYLLRLLSTAGVVVFYLGHISADLIWDTALSSVVVSGKQWITNKVYRIIIVFCALFFIYLGLVFLRQGLFL